MISLLKYFFRDKHKDDWFKWLSWVIITVAISAAWWKTKSPIMLIIVIVSVAYTIHSFWMGLSDFFGEYLSQWNLKNWQLYIVYAFLVPFFTLGPLYVLIPLTIGLLP